MTKLKALLIDDDKKFCQTFESLAEDTFSLIVTHSGKEGLKEFQKNNFDVVFLDLKLGRGMNGLEILKRIKKINEGIPVIMVTDFADVDTAVEAMKLGAFHYTSKSPNINALKLIIERQIEQINWKRLLKDQETDHYVKFIAKSRVMQTILKQIEKIAKTDSTALIEGESGTGKEVCARELHRQSARCDKPFVAVNCSTLVSQLFESEFFGYEKGAFTGADGQKLGKLELANRGTIFLDEIGDLPLESQAKILRAIEEKQFQRLGGVENLSVDVRIIAATNKSLSTLVKENKFREDLFFRLNVISIFLPPIREREEDILEFAKLFIKKYAMQLKKPIAELPAALENKLKKYSWPGNVRELKNTIERMMVLHTQGEPYTANELGLKNEKTEFIYPQEILDAPYEKAKTLLFNDFKIIYFNRALAKNKGNISITAKELGINRSALHKMLKDLNIN